MPDDMTAQGVRSTFLTFTSEENGIMNAAAGLAADLLPIERLHGLGAFDLTPAARATLGELGWFALSLPEQFGGSALSAVEQALFFREMGRQCAPIDILAQSLAVHVATENTVLRRRLLGGACSVALAEPAGGGVRLVGGADAEFALLADPQGAGLYALAGLAPETRPGLDPATTLRIIPSLADPVARLDTATVWEFGQLSVAAMLVGVAEAALDLIVEYAKVRETFGRKIGAYQAVRHPCADMAVRVEAARSQLWYAAAALKAGRGDARTHLIAAKHLANEAALANADTNIQLHGGIGVTDEHHAHLLLKRALLLGRLFGAKRTLLAELLHARIED